MKSLILIAFITATAFSSDAQIVIKEKNSQSNYPEFSWNTIPLYMHIRKATAFTNDEIKFIAKHPLITFEKTTGNKTFGSTETGTIKAAEAVKKINPNAKILYYKNVVINWPTYEEDELFLKDNPDAILTNNKNEKALMPNKRTGFFDISKEPVKNYWLNHVTKVVNNPSIDGVFLDANLKVLVPAFFNSRVNTEKQKTIYDSYLSMMTELQNRLDKNNLLIANIIRVRPEFKEEGLEYLHFFDGSYIEGFEHENFGMTYADYLAKGIKAVQKAARDGKIIAMSLGIGEAAENSEIGFDDQRNRVKLDEQLNERIDYLLAIFLVCAEKYSYIYPHDGYASENSAVWLKTFPQYTKKLGAPKGYASKKGYIYTRSFEHLDVWLDIEHKKATLTWK
ncbi:putative glycoside hydrolase [Formosa sp. PL04]|uniref:putative glycoside hydrolase n=1 Tax=Formosa sp. PL04 TaxID=3081755 RepID=UPI002980B6AF|nr:putative glycoside hydrolase [Formosa sp. PL04]MDW5290117.1 putative glycoside hydrolase [Formosa sp. PL04]